MRALIWCAVSTKIQADQDRLSLPEQERLACETAARHNWTITDVLLVPGHSRDYIDIHQCAADMERQGIPAYTQLLAHLRAADFDILITRDGDRFARTQSLHAYITESVIAINARIYSLQDGWIDDKNYRMWTAMSGYKAASEMDRLVAGGHITRRFRAESGILNNSTPLLSHLTVRDERGRRVGTMVDESKRDLFRAVAILITTPVGWLKLEYALAHQFGFLNPRTNAPYSPGTFRKIVYNPGFWGHSAQRYSGKYGAWVYDSTESPPPGATIFYNTHTAMWPDDWTTTHDGILITRDDILAALRRREQIIVGRRRGVVRAFSGLLMCARCGNHLRLKISNYQRLDGVRRAAWQCQHYTRDTEGRLALRACENRRHVSDLRVREYLHLLLQEIVLAPDLTAFFAQRTTTDEAALHAQISAHQETQSRLNARLLKLISDRADAPPAADAHYLSMIQSTSTQLDGLKSELTALRSRLKAEIIAPDQKKAAHDLAALTLDKFWVQDDTTINIALHRLLGNYRLSCDNGAIIGIQHLKNRRS